MDQGTEPIRQDIDQIRASMTDKMERIEAKIKGTVDETAGSVKRMVDLKYQASEHPWAAIGASVLAGIVLGSLGDQDPPERRSERPNDGLSTDEAYRYARSVAPYPSNESYGYGQAPYGRSSYTTPGSASAGYDRPYSPDYSQSSLQRQNYGASQAGDNQPSTFAPSNTDWSGSTGSNRNSWNGGTGQTSKPGIVDQLSRQFGDEIEVLKTAAVSTLVSVLRDTIRQNLPSMHQEMERMRRNSAASTGATNLTGSSYAHSAANK
jgi:ElaB/YqjD/DUF883 family membrane-anchored ribosome-binding protein